RSVLRLPPEGGGAAGVDGVRHPVHAAAGQGGRDAAGRRRQLNRLVYRLRPLLLPSPLAGEGSGVRGRCRRRKDWRPSVLFLCKLLCKSLTPPHPSPDPSPLAGEGRNAPLTPDPSPARGEGRKHMPRSSTTFATKPPQALSSPGRGQR